MRTILIPTDFTSVPLLLLKHAVANSKEKLDVIFMYSTFLSTSITELLFSSPTKTINQAISEEFRDGCSIIQNRYGERIGNIRYEVLYGNNMSLFTSLVDANRIDAVLLPTDYAFVSTGMMFDPTRLILNSPARVHKIDLHLTMRVSQHDIIAGLLTS